MWGAIIGDVIGSTFEIENNRSKHFEFFRKDARFTDDSITTVAVASILMKNSKYLLIESDINMLNNDLNGYKLAYEQHAFPNISPTLSSMELRSWCYPYLARGFGGMFYNWLENGQARAYQSYGNGGLMRSSPVAFWCVKKGMSKLKTINTGLAINNLTHNHPVAQSVMEVYMDIMHEILTNKEMSIEDKKDYCVSRLNEKGFNTKKTVFKYMVSSEYDLRASTALEMVVASIRESSSFDEAMQNLVCCGGDTDTICAIGGGVAEAIWGVPKEHIESVRLYFKGYHKALLDKLEEFYVALES